MSTSNSFVLKAGIFIIVVSILVIISTFVFTFQHEDINSSLLFINQQVNDIIPDFLPTTDNITYDIYTGEPQLQNTNIETNKQQEEKSEPSSNIAPISISSATTTVINNIRTILTKPNTPYPKSSEPQYIDLNAYKYYNRTNNIIS